MTHPLRLLLVTFFVGGLSLGIEGLLLQIGVPLALVPEFVLLFVIFLSFYVASSYGVFLAFLCGFLVDMSSGGLLGPWAGSYVICFGAVSLISDRIYVESGFSLVFISVVLTLLSQIIYLLISIDPFSQLFSEWLSLCGRAMSTAVMAPLFFPFLRKLFSYSRGDSIRGRSGGYS
ncbi:rod shape-determining protein MreD [bacterium]|nr:rod shape-determining protein MreD [bacterium]